MTSLPQLLAEELDVPLASVDIVMGDTDLCPWDMGTFGSLSIRIVRAGAARRRPPKRARCCCRWPPSGCRCRSRRSSVKAGVVTRQGGRDEDGDLRRS